MKPVLPALLLFSAAASVAAQEAANSTPAANPARPTVTNPATLPPVGYLQFEQGYLGSLASPETDAQYGMNQVTKIAVHPRLLIQSQLQPYAASRAVGDTQFTNGFGDVLLGAQVVLYTPAPGHLGSAITPRTDADAPPAPKPKLAAISLGYLGRVHSGTTGDTDLGSASNSLVLLLSGDLGSFHYDTNYIINEQTDGVVRRAQTAETLSINHALWNDNAQLSVELYHFTQPLVSTDDHGQAVLHAHLVDLLVAPSYQLRPNLVVDFGFSRGLTSTSTRWQSFAGFTYLLPHRLWPEHHTHS